MSKLLLILLCATCARMALGAPATRVAAVDPGGVLRWSDDGSEVALFGVNYYTPFSIDYATLKANGCDHDQAIRDDVTHFQRLGLTAIRLHCFDREISDRQGNLVDNEHLRLLDYLISQAKARGIYSVMTPIAWWQTPAPGGFSDLYSMQQMTTDPQAWVAQCRYLTQYFNHVNRYTGLAYKDDPAIVAVELINEPQYPQDITPAKITEYVNTLCRAIRDTGCRKPLFYNCWGGYHAAGAASTLDGITFGWYPTGLAGGHMLRDNYLPRVDDYADMRDPVLAKKAKIVYEFDSADVHGSVLYPAMARAFRSGGAQIATQFQYEVLCVAAGNPDWQTHYLNLCYTPHKALSFAIAAEAMRRLPRLKTYGVYPQSARFGDFRLDFTRDLSELVTADTFLYSNDTDTQPPAPEQLTRIAGCGSSPVVKYQGAGAYFLDRLEPGVWKLQVYPDAVMVADPYSGGTNEKVRILWAPWRMEARLPDLGEDFTVQPAGPSAQPAPVQGAGFLATPGQYLLLARGKAAPAEVPGVEFVAPPSSTAPPTAFVDAPEDWLEGHALTVQASVAAPPGTTCSLRYQPGGKADFVTLPMAGRRAYEVAATVPAELVTPGTARYYLCLRSGDQVINLPGGDRGERAATALTPAPPVELLRLAASDEAPKATYGGPEGKSARASLVAGRDAGGRALRLEADGFGPMPSCASTEWPIRDLPADLSAYNTVTFLARGAPNTTMLEISLVEPDRSGFGTDVPLTSRWREYTVPLSRLRAMWSTKTAAPNLARLCTLTFVFGAWNLGDLRAKPHWAEVQSVRLGRRSNLWEMAVAERAAPVVLMEPARRSLQVGGHPGSLRQVAGMDADKVALRIAVEGFGPPPDCLGFRLAVPPETSVWRDQMAAATTLVVKARAGQPATDRFELVLVERDGSPWGLEVPLTADWQAVKIPLAQLRYFKHWNPPDNGRGGPGDRLRPENIVDVNVCFGAWEFPRTFAQPQAIELQDVSLTRE